MLRVGGLMIMSMNDGPGAKFVMNMINTVNEFPNCEFLGCISYYNEFRVKNNKHYGKGTWQKNSGTNVTFKVGDKFPQPISPQPFWVWAKK